MRSKRLTPAANLRGVLAAIAVAGALALGCAAPPPAALPDQHQAIESGDLEFLGKLLAEGRGSENHERESPLHRAARRQDSIGPQAVKLLLEAGVDANHPGREGRGKHGESLRWRPLYYAVDTGNVETTRLLLAGGADPNIASEDARRPESALEVAVRGPDAGRATQIVALLLEHGADVERSSYRIKRPLCGALRERNQPAVTLLVRAGARTACIDEIVITNEDRTLYTSMVDSARAVASPNPRAASIASRAATSPPAPAPPPERRIPDVRFGSYHALVVGNDAYRSLPQLGTAISDARAIAELLSSVYDFRVEVLENATRSDLMSALTRYRKHLGPQDNLLIYYAGHGWHDEDAGESYWLPIDAEEHDPTYWISNSTIATSLRAMRAKHVLLVADSCYSGTLTRGIRRGVDPSERHPLARLAEKRARTALTSGGVEPVEDDAGNGHSVFANALLQSLKTNDGVLAGAELFTSIRRPVMLGSDQTPQYGDIRKAGHEDGEFLFVRRSQP